MVILNKFVKKLLLGLIVWAVPFFSSFFVWDLEANAPSVSMGWFNAVMAFAWAIGFAIAAYLYFKGIKKDIVNEAWSTGITWYIELLVLDLIILVGLFKMAMSDFYPLMLTYLNAIAISVSIGYILKK